MDSFLQRAILDKTPNINGPDVTVSINHRSLQTSSYAVHELAPSFQAIQFIIKFNDKPWISADMHTHLRPLSYL